MGDIGSSLRCQILQENIDMFRTPQVVSTALPSGEIPLDIDVTPLDNSESKKDSVLLIYKGFDGYALIMAYIVKGGSSQCGTPRSVSAFSKRDIAFFQRSIPPEPQTDRCPAYDLDLDGFKK